MKMKMKMTKKLLVTLAVATLAFAGTISVSANTVEPTVINHDGALSQSKEVGVSSTIFSPRATLIYGVTPVISGFDSLTQTIYDDLYEVFKLTRSYQAPIEEMQTSDMSTTFSIELTPGYLVVKTQALLKNSHQFVSVQTYDFTYYINTTDKKVLTEEQYTAELEAAAEALESEDAAAEDSEATEGESNELAMVALRKSAEALGFEVTWNAETSYVEVISEDKTISFKADLSTYLVDGEEVELELAPVNLDGVTYVPSTFFTELLDVDAETVETFEVMPEVEPATADEAEANDEIPEATEETEATDEVETTEEAEEVVEA